MDDKIESNMTGGPVQVLGWENGQNQGGGSQSKAFFGPAHIPRVVSKCFLFMSAFGKCYLGERSCVIYSRSHEQ